MQKHFSKWPGSRSFIEAIVFFVCILLLPYRCESCLHGGCARFKWVAGYAWGGNGAYDWENAAINFDTYRFVLRNGLAPQEHSHRLLGVKMASLVADELEI
jgi:hypothetical protein